ncbi:MAG: ABC transporter permease, partial [Planctomycetales bacterium]
MTDKKQPEQPDAVREDDPRDDRPSVKSLARGAARMFMPLLGLVAVVTLFASLEFLLEAWQALDDGLPLGEFFADYDSRFLQGRNFQNILVQTTTVAIAALGMTIIIIAGGIDLSAGTALALSATVAAIMLRDGPSTILEMLSANVAVPLFGAELPIPDPPVGEASYVALAILCGIGVACLAGLLNGALITVLRVAPFIVTLGTMTVYLGLAKWVANETTVRPDRYTQVPAWIPALVKPLPDFRWPIVPTGVWLLLFLSVALALVLRYTVFGRYVFALGSNESTAR